MTKVLAGCGGGYVNMWNLFQKISGYSYTSPNIPALKYGREMEKHAENKFHEIFKTTHKSVSLNESGLFLEESNPFIRASPDRVSRCSCHPDACLEIKCPFSISHLSPNDPTVKLEYIEQNENETASLKRKHKYYRQCQQQMGVTGLKKCYFFVWTSHGYILEEINFDSDFYKELVELLSDFYKRFYLERKLLQWLVSQQAEECKMILEVKLL